MPTGPTAGGSPQQAALAQASQEGIEVVTGGGLVDNALKTLMRRLLREEPTDCD